MIALKILVVNDDQFDRMLLVRYLKAIEPTSEIVEADSGKVAFDLLKTTKIDCMFVDYHLPDWNGVELITRLREQKLYAPAVLMTEYKGEEIAASAIRAGVVDFIDKSTLSIRSLTPALARIEQVIAQNAKISSAQSALQEYEAMYRALFENSVYGLLLINEQDMIIDANQVACDMLGFQAKDLIGITRSELVSRDNPRYEMAFLCGEQAKFIGEMILQRHDLSTFTAKVTCFALPPTGGQSVRLFSIQNITGSKPRESVS